MSALVLDIETVADCGPEDWPRAAALKEMWEAGGERQESPLAFAALSPPLARVVCVGFRDVGSGKEMAVLDAKLLGTPENWAQEPQVRARQGEDMVLQAVNETLSSRAVERLVTFRGRSFDLPVLIHRMLVHSIRPAARLLAAFREYRYKPSIHVDLWDAFTGFGAVNGGCTLRAFAIGYGFDDPKANGSGAEVAQLVERGDGAALADYCLGDVRSTAALYERWVALCGIAG
jgi:DNA polymerase elongation subunit (family B)